MGWADRAISELLAKNSVTIYPKGNSMLPKIKSGDEVVLNPVKYTDILEKGDVVLVRVKGSVYLHKVKAVRGTRYQISNNKGRVNGWVGIQAVYGIVESITTRFG